MERLNGGTEYDLGRDFLGSARLNLQHYLWKDTLGYDLHPTIPTGQKGLRIADVGTGTGIFLFGLCRQFPGPASFHGLDISNEQFPCLEWTPSNITFRKVDAMTDPPADLHESFDIVHLRLFTCVVENNDPLPVLRHCIKLLRPSGYLQWDEYDPGNTGVTAGNHTTSTQLLHAMLQAMASNRPLGWIENLDDHFRAEGMCSVQLTRVRPPLELLKPYTEMLLVAHLEHASLHDADGATVGGDRVRKFIGQCAEEMKNGGAFNHMLQVVVGRKPFVVSKVEERSSL